MRSDFDPRAASGVEVDGAWAREADAREGRRPPRLTRGLELDFFLGGTVKGVGSLASPDGIEPSSPV